MTYRSYLFPSWSAFTAQSAVVLACAILASAVLSSPVFAGVVFEIETTDHGQSPPKVETIQAYVEGKSLKMEITNGKKGAQNDEAIFRGDRRQMIVVDHTNKSYMVIDQDMVQGVSGQVNSALEQARKALENVPADQRAMVEEMLKRQMPQQTVAQPNVEIRKTGKTGKHLTYPFQQYEVWIGDRKEDELDITAWKNIEGGEDVADVFLEMSSFFRELMDSLGELGGGAGAGFGQQDLFFDHLTEVDGFPVRSRDFHEDGSLEDETALRSARRMEIDPDAFEPPSGYKRQEMFPN